MTPRFDPREARDLGAFWCVLLGALAFVALVTAYGRSITWPFDAWSVVGAEVEPMGAHANLPAALAPHGFRSPGSASWAA